MIKDCTYYWNKIGQLYVADLDDEGRMELAEKYLSKDEIEHLKELLQA